MIAYMDAEYNCCGDDKSLIEIAVIVCENNKTNEIIQVYHTFVKPRMNKGKIYPKIQELTNISQQDIDKGKNISQVGDDILELISKYKICAIYHYGDYDRHAFEWNFLRKSEFSKYRVIVYKLKDVMENVVMRLGMLEPVCLKDMAYLCGCPSENYHNALDDAKTLMNIMYKINRFDYDMNMMNRFRDFQKKRRLYNKLKVILNEAERKGQSDILDMVLSGEPFPDFEDYLKDIDM